MAGAQVQNGVAEAQLVHLAALTAQQGIDTGQQLPDVEGFGQIVVGTGIQARHPVLDARAGGQHQNGHGTVAGAEGLGHLTSIQLRQHHVQDQQIIDAQPGVFEPRGAVVYRIHLEALLLQNRPDGLGQKLLVLDHQNFHGIPPLLLYHYFCTIIIRELAEGKLKNPVFTKVSYPIGGADCH